MTFRSKLFPILGLIGLTLIWGCDEREKLNSYKSQYTSCIPLYQAALDHRDSMIVNTYKPWDRYGTNCLIARQRIDSLERYLSRE